MLGLVAAVSLGLGGWLFLADANQRIIDSPELRDFGEVLLDYGPIPRTTTGWVHLGSLVVLCVACFIVARDRHFPHIEKLRPGYADCVAVLLGVGIQFVESLTTLTYNAQRFLPLWRNVSYQLLESAFQTTPLAAAILGCWYCLWRTGRWKRSSGAIDLIGRLVGLWFFAAYGFHLIDNVKTMIDCYMGWGITVP